MYILMNATTTMSPWQQFGLAGLCLFALFSLLGWLLKTGLDKFEKVVTTNRESLETLASEAKQERIDNADSHREERNGWRDQIKVQHDESISVMRDVERAIKDIGNRDRSV